MSQTTMITIGGLAVSILVYVISIVWFAGRLQAQIDVVLQKLETNKAENSNRLSEASREIERRFDERFDTLEGSISGMDRRIAVLEERSGHR